MAVLHLISRCPHQGWDAVVGRIAPGDSVLLLADGVLGVRSEAEGLVAKGARVYVLQPDIEARGLLRDHAAIRIIGFEEFVDLTVTHKRILSW